ncbi:MAG: TIGR03089 family protein, partial [Actinomycetota bacterium]|nr:TIGR03089 family protein [Actinomycetota bacterium]
PGARLMTDLNPAEPDDLVAGPLAAMAVGGSVVLVRHPDPAARDQRVAQERVTDQAWRAG